MTTIAKIEVQARFRLFVRGDGQAYVQQLSRQRRGLLQQGEDQGPDHRRGDGARRKADALDRRADRDLRKREEHFPAGDTDPHLVLRAEGQTVRVQLARASERGDREEDIRRPEGRGEDHDFGQDAGSRISCAASTKWSIDWIRDARVLSGTAA